MPTDRHGRARRVDNDRRHRPTDGFRTATLERFLVLLDDALAALPEHLGEPVDAADIVVADVPDTDHDGEIPLARFFPAGAGRGAVLVVYRRPVELRALGRADLVDLLRLVCGRAVADALGLDPGPDDEA